MQTHLGRESFPRHVLPHSAGHVTKSLPTPEELRWTLDPKIAQPPLTCVLPQNDGPTASSSGTEDMEPAEMYKFTKAAMTRCHRLDGFNSGIFNNSEAQKSKVKGCWIW